MDEGRGKDKFGSSTIDSRGGRTKEEEKELEKREKERKRVWTEKERKRFVEYFGKKEEKRGKMEDKWGRLEWKKGRQTTMKRVEGEIKKRKKSG